MNIDIQKAGSKVFVALEGRVGSATAPELEEKLLGELKDISELVFDFAKVEYISMLTRPFPACRKRSHR